MQFEVDGHQTYAATGGRPFDLAKPTVIFIHGAGMDHSYWQLQSRWFAWHGWSVLAVDLPGHGRSDGDPLTSIAGMGAWIGRLMDAAGVKTATVIGHSMGSAVALEAAALLTGRVDRLALLGVSETIPVHPALLKAAEANDPKAYDMMTAWGHGPSAKMGKQGSRHLDAWRRARALGAEQARRPLCGPESLRRLADRCGGGRADRLPDRYHLRHPRRHDAPEEGPGTGG
jgi:pimeloyl-ACP methyl ester carboxylesterase